MGAATAWPVPSREPQHTFACSDFLPLCSMQEKLWKYTQIQTPLARGHPTPGEAAELPDMVVRKAGSVTGCCSCRDSAPRRAPVRGEKQRCNIFKVSQSIQLHPGSWSRRHTELMFYTFGYRFEFFPPHAKYLKPLETHDLTINDCAVLSI